MERLADPSFRLKPTSGTSDFDLHPELRPKNRSLRQAAVVIPLQERGNDWHVVLTKRSPQLAHHPGQIAFPGGKVDQSDGTAINAALREAKEEIGLNPAALTLVGELGSHETVTGYFVHPYVAVVHGSFVPLPETGEVDEVFFVPLSHLMKPENYLIQSRAWMGVQRGYYTVPYGPYYIWGATARMLRMLCDSLEGPNAG